MHRFSDIISKITKASKTVGADEIATFCDLSMIISQKSNQISDIILLDIVVAILSDAVDLINTHIKYLQKSGGRTLDAPVTTKAFVTRL
jgi:predicted sugar kinase